MVSTDSLRILLVVMAFVLTLPLSLSRLLRPIGRPKCHFLPVREPVEIIRRHYVAGTYAIYHGIGRVRRACGNGLDLDGRIGLSVFRLFDQIDVGRFGIALDGRIRQERDITKCIDQEVHIYKLVWEQ